MPERSDSESPESSDSPDLIPELIELDAESVWLRVRPQPDMPVSTRLKLGTAKSAASMEPYGPPPPAPAPPEPLPPDAMAACRCCSIHGLPMSIIVSPNDENIDPGARCCCEPGLPDMATCDSPCERP